MQMAVLNFCGVKDIPSFDSLGLVSTKKKKLGEACGNRNIERCKRFFNLNEEGLETLACSKCEVVEVK